MRLYSTIGAALLAGLGLAFAGSSGVAGTDASGCCCKPVCVCEDCTCGTDVPCNCGHCDCETVCDCDAS